MLTSVVSTVDIEISFTSFSILPFMLEMFHSFNIYIKTNKKSQLAKLSSMYKVYIPSMSPWEKLLHDENQAIIKLSK